MRSRPKSKSREQFAELRLQAWQLFQQGWQKHQIADFLGVSRSSVSEWIVRAEQDNEVAFLEHPTKVKAISLTSGQHKELEELLHKGPEAFGFKCNVWTDQRVAALIQHHFGVSYSMRIIRGIRKTYGLQRHLNRATDVPDHDVEVTTLKSQRSFATTVPSSKRAPTNQKPRLSDAQRNKLKQLIRMGPEALGFKGNRWTQKSVTMLIQLHFGVSYHPKYISYLLRNIGISLSSLAPQRHEDNLVIQSWKHKGQTDETEQD